MQQFAGMAQSLFREKEQRTSRRATYPLTLMAVAFVLPAHRTCSGEEFKSPAEHISGGDILLIAPVFVFAALLAFLTARSMAHGEVTLGRRRLALAPIWFLALGNIALALDQARHLNSSSILSSLGFILALTVVLTALAVVVLRRARGQHPWRIWEHLLCAFAIAAPATFPATFLNSLVLCGSDSVTYGAHLFLASQLWLLAVTVPAVLRRERRTHPTLQTMARWTA